MERRSPRTAAKIRHQIRMYLYLASDIELRATREAEKDG
jgi:hypothetical protein